MTTDIAVAVRQSEPDPHVLESSPDEPLHALKHSDDAQRLQTIHGVGPTVWLSLPEGATRQVTWGQPWQYRSAAYWVAITKEWQVARAVEARPHRLAGTFAEEVVACLLGGHGITYEMNMAAFRAIRDADLIDDRVVPDAKMIAEVLKQPLTINARQVHYRFPNQKSVRIANALRHIHASATPGDALEARSWLMTLDGIGPKTASWIVRNFYGSDCVAIIDIHIMRAAIEAHIFDPRWSPTRDYWLMESAFLQWAKIGNVSAADLDAVVWVEQATIARRGGRAANARVPGEQVQSAQPRRSQ